MQLEIRIILILYTLHAAIDVELKALTTEHYITEPSSGESVTVPICYTTLVYRTLNRITTINIDVLEQGIYPIDENVLEFSHKHFTITADFIGKFTDCGIMTVIGNDIFDGSIRIAMFFTTQNIIISQSHNSDILIHGNRGWSRYPL